MNYARKWHEAGSKRVESRVKNETNQAQKWHKLGSNEGQPGSKMAQTGLENGTNQAREKHEPGSNQHAKWLELRHDRRIDVTQMTGNSVVCHWV